MPDAEAKLAKIAELAGRHGSAHPAYHKFCHAHPEDRCPDCRWLAELLSILHDQPVEQISLPYRESAHAER